jgi:hypothetical protein
MCHIPKLLAIIVCPILLTACVVNSVRPLPAGSFAMNGRAIVVYGVGTEDNHAVHVELDQYDMATQTAGNCFSFNRMEADALPPSGPVKYVAFDVPPGVYTYSRFNTTSLEQALPPGAQQDASAPKITGFVVPEGGVVYLGDFILRHSTLVFQHDLDAFNKAKNALLPNLRGEVSLAKELAVKQPPGFLCTP